MGSIEMLREMREYGGSQRTSGLDDATIERFTTLDPALGETISDALDQHKALRGEFAEFLKQDEADQILQAQDGLVNFYPDDAVNPYLPAAARGPWIVTLKGAVIHDNGGYGMLGFGHNVPAVQEALAKPQAMANVMTPSIAQMRFDKALNSELGHARGGNPFARFMCLNSGSEAVTLGARIADVNAKDMTDPGATHAGQPIKHLVVRGAFHGRTGEPARFSDSSRGAYVQNLASYRDDDSLITVEPYDVDDLKAAFARAEENGWFIDAMFLEPVMGEGDPGRAVTPEFYAAARELTREHNAMFLVDSIQAGMRTQGVLSIVDYPGFEKLDAPDMESYSKALNAGQYPLSVLAVNNKAAELYRKGIYGNTMSSNPRALDVGCATLSLLSDGVRDNICMRGKEFVDKLNALKDELDGLITKVQGTGLLFSCELAPQFKCFGADSTEEYLREHGIGVIHGGENSLRFTPHFNVTSAEVDLIIDHVRTALQEGPRQSKSQAA